MSIAPDSMRSPASAMAIPARVVASAAGEMSTTISIESTKVYVLWLLPSALTRLRAGRKKGEQGDDGSFGRVGRAESGLVGGGTGGG